jgi:hypothetical protein
VSQARQLANAVAYGRVRARWRLAASLATLLLVTGLVWLGTTGDARIWPVRHTLEYRALHWWWDRTGFPQQGPPGELTGTVRDRQGGPSPARAGTARPVGWRLFAGGADGAIRSPGSGGRYVPVAWADGYDARRLVPAGAVAGLRAAAG